MDSQNVITTGFKHKKKIKSQSPKTLQETGGLKLSWSKPKNKITGTVIRKKNDGIAKSAPKLDTAVSLQTKHEDVKTLQSSNKSFKVHKKLRDTNSNSANIKTSTQVHIKRKHKKDRLKSQLEGESDFGTKNLDNVTSRNTILPFNKVQKDVRMHTHSGKSVSEKLFNEEERTFSDLPLHRHVISNLEKHNFIKLTTVQDKAIPIVLSGKNVLIRSQTGSGKTLAYAAPIVDALRNLTPKLERKNGVQAIVVVPTRELALQTHEHFTKINTFQWIVAGHLCGGENRKTEKERLRKGIHILIGTPGRILDHVRHTTALKIGNVRCLVLDEADRLLDMGFRKDIISLVEELQRVKTDSRYDALQILKTQNKKIMFNEEDIIEEDENFDENEFPLTNIGSNRRQTILLSATLSKGVSELADFAMKDHVFIDAFQDATNDSSNRNSDSLIIPDTVKQEFILTYVKERLFTLSALIVAKTRKKSKMFVFMASTQMVEFHYDLFSQALLRMSRNRGKLKKGDVVLLDVDDENSDDEENIVLDTQIFKLHGNMDQKERKQVFNDFRKADSGVLLCTDVAARGLDVPAADCIVQYTGPQTDEDYLHRVGRTGRAGQAGSAIIFLTHEEQEYVSRLAEHRVYLKQRNPDIFLKHLCEIMEEPDQERAAEALQRRYETAIANDEALHKTACFAYSTWSRFYNSYPTKMRSIFSFKKINLGHYASSFGLRDTPSQISKIVRGEVTKFETPRLNKKLANYMESRPSGPKSKPKRSVALMTSEYSSGLEPVRKKKKKD